jgi:hypothetical protein
MTLKEVLIGFDIFLGLVLLYLVFATIAEWWADRNSRIESEIEKDREHYRQMKSQTFFDDVTQVVHSQPPPIPRINK